MKKTMTAAAVALLLGTFAAGNTFAFSDVDGDQNAAITSLQQQGVVTGVDSDHFAPKQSMSYAEALQMVVKAFDINLDTVRFVREPLASELYPNARDHVWYSQAFIISYYNNIRLPGDVVPSAKITREQFADLIVQALEKKGDFPLVKMFIDIKDNDSITAEMQGSVQRLLLYKIAKLDADGNFHPKLEITRGEAAIWIYNGKQLVDHWTPEGSAQTEDNGADQ